MATRLANPTPQFFYNGTPAAPLAGGLMYFYVTGASLVPKDTYSDNALTIPNSNPVVLSSSGVLPNVFLNGAYRVILKDKNGVQQSDRDDVNSIDVIPGTVRDYQAFTSSGTWTKPTDCTFVYVEVWAGGGGGANSSAGAALLGGASGGEYVSGWFEESALAGTVTITVGAGGAGAAVGVGVGGGFPGGASSFGLHLAAVGGNGGPTTVDHAATVPRSPIATQLQTTGEFRTVVLPQSGGGGSSASGYTAGRNTIYGGAGGGASADGAGGVSAYGGNGGAGNSGAGTPGGNGSAPGGGGGSSENNGGGGSGGRGEVRVWAW